MAFNQSSTAIYLPGRRVKQKVEFMINDLSPYWSTMTIVDQSPIQNTFCPFLCIHDYPYFGRYFCFFQSSGERDRDRERERETGLIWSKWTIGDHRTAKWKPDCVEHRSYKFSLGNCFLYFYFHFLHILLLLFICITSLILLLKFF